MRVKTTEFEGLYIIEGIKFKDNRGDLIKPFSQLFIPNGLAENINTDFKEVWFTRSYKDVIRAMHMQVGPKACSKLVSVILGGVLDVIIDLRKDSKTYKKWFEIELSDENQLALYIPRGCAHGYKVLADNTITLYMATDTHDAYNDVGIRWDSFGYDWKVSKPVISSKDLELPKLL